MEDNGSKCTVSIDEIDFRICEPTPFDSKWFSHKFRGPGLHYEIGICIPTGWIVWVKGLYECGDWPDIEIARAELHDALEYGEFYLADSGYRNGDYYSVTSNGLSNCDQRMKSIVPARHETVNKRFRQWCCLERRFRHKRALHSKCLFAVANFTQFAIEDDEPLFDVFYNNV